MSTPQQPSNSDHEEPQRQPSKAMTLALFVLLALWVISIATGTVLFGEIPNWRKPVFVLAPMIVFLSLWAVLLFRRNGIANQNKWILRWSVEDLRLLQPGI